MESAPARGGLNRAHLQCRNLQEFLGGLSPGVLDRLYGHPATCLAVFRELPSLAKNWVMRMLFLEQPLPQAAVALWVKKEFSKAQEESTGLLSGLRIWHTQLLPGGLQGLILNPIFRQNLRIALLGGGKAWSDDTSQLGPDKHARDVPSLDKYAEERWEVVLHFMVGSPSAAVSQDLAQLLSQAGLMKSAEPGEPPCITSAGFQFLLLDTSAQLWYFMLQYLQTAQSRGMDLVEILSFLFQLSFSTLGKDYSVEGMSDSLLNFLQHLREFGLVFQRKEDARVVTEDPISCALPEEVPALLPHAPSHQPLVWRLWGWGHCAPAGLHCRGNQLPTVCLYRVGAADRSHRPLLRDALSVPQHGGGTGDPGERAAGHCQWHHSPADNPFPKDKGPSSDAQTDSCAASHHNRPDSAVGAGEGQTSFH
ncbi:general transcription factor IIH subunit 4 isoform X2 [Alexandromys fortis]|uniref:general transcription factor IIH subunit 4 isoform X2 n=1 Tax=Alexandromys fortis TaxID=100897 RepID=UPI002152FBBE|nr:general transcription factor IIH subunit 4 isoform X2 [Microtus fortis]